MAEEVVRLGLDARDAVRGAQTFDAALDQVIAGATGAAEANERLQSEMSRLSSIARQAAAALGFVGFGALAKEVLSVGAEMDSLRRGLIAVAGGALQANRQLRELEEVAKAPGLGFKEAIQGAIRLEAVGISAERAERALKAFGNAVATTGGGKAELDRITFQLGQMAAKGKVLELDLRPIIETAPAVARALQEAFGTVDAEQISALGISAEEFIDKLVAQLEKLPPVTSGAKTAFENLTDAATRASDAISQQVLPALGEAAEGASHVLDAIAKADPSTIRAGLDALATSAEFVAAVYTGKLVVAIGKKIASQVAEVRADLAARQAAVAKAEAQLAAARAAQADALAAVEAARAHAALAANMGTGSIAATEQLAALSRLAVANQAVAATDALVEQAEAAKAAAMGRSTVAATAASRALALVGGPQGLAILAAAAAAIALFKLFEHYADKAREPQRAAESLAESQRNLADHFASVSREAAKAAEAVLAAGRAQAEARLQALGAEAAPLRARVQAGTTTREVPVFADVGGTSVQTGTRTVRVLSRDAQEAQRALAPLEKQIAEAATQVTGYARAQEGLSRALRQFAAQDARAAADATAEQAKRYAELRDALTEQIAAQQTLAHAYSLGTAAGDEAADRLQAEAQVRKSAKTLTDAQTEAILALARAQKAAENDAAFARILAASSDSVRVQRSLAEAYRISAEAGKRREEELKDEAEFLKRAKDVGGGYAAALILQGKSEDEARAALEARLVALGESEAQARADASAQIDLALAIAGTVMAERQAENAMSIQRDGASRLTREIMTLSAEYKRLAANANVFRNATGGTVRAPGLDQARRESGLRPVVSEARTAGEQVQEIFRSAIEGIQRDFADAFKSIWSDGIRGFEDMASRIADLFLDTAAQIAAAFAAHALGLDEAVRKLQQIIDHKDSFNAATGLIGPGRGGVAGGLIGGAVGFETGSIGAGVFAGAASGFALGGPIGGVVGAVGGLVGGLLGHAEKAKEAARRMEEAEQAFQASLDDMVADALATSDLSRDVVRVTEEIQRQLGEFKKIHPKDIFVASDLQIPGASNVIKVDVTKLFHIDPHLSGQAQLDALRQQQAAYAAFVAKVTDPKLRAELEEMGEAFDAWIDDLEKVNEEAKKSFEEDLTVRELRAKGLDEEADAAERAAQHRRELAEAEKQFGPDSPYVQHLKDVQAAEDAAAEAAAERARKEKELQDARDLRDFNANFAALKAGRGTLDEAVIRATAQAQQQADAMLDSAQKLRDAGLISEETFQEFADLLENDVAKAAEEAAKAWKRAAEDIQNSITERGLRAFGHDAEADLFRFKAQEQRDIEDMQAAFEAGQITQEQLDYFVNVVVPREIQNFIDQQKAQSAAQQAAAGGGRATAAFEAKQETVASVQALSEVTGSRIADIALSQLVVEREQLRVLSSMAEHMGVLATNDGPSLLPFGVGGAPFGALGATAPVRPAPAPAQAPVTITIDTVFGGDVTLNGDAASPTLVADLTDELVPAISNILARQFANVMRNAGRSGG